MPVIRQDGHLSDGKGNHAEYAFSYVCFERVMEAFERLRELSRGYGHYQRSARGHESYNLGLDRRRGSPLEKADNVPTGVVLPFKVTTLDAPTGTPGRKTTTYSVRLNREDPAEILPHTSAAGSTLNAIAWALATGGVDANGVVVPKLTEGWLPERFGELWTVRATEGEDLSDAAKQEEWGQGAARAIQHFNLGVQIDPLQLRRGDAVQLGAHPDAPHRSSAAFCFATRRVQKGEVRFVYLSSQIDTAGIGVRLNDLARMGILSQGPATDARVKILLQDYSSQPLGEHRFMLQVADRVFVGKSDENGKVDVAVAGEAQAGYLSFWVRHGEDEDDDECITWKLKVARYEGSGGSDGGEGRAREEYVVTSGSRPFKLYVYHPGPLTRARFVTHALRYGSWQHLTAGEGEKHALLGPWRGHVHAARLNAEFPRYPIALFGSNDLDYIDTEGNAADLETTTARYYRNTERLTGGYFPLGRSRVWHGGVHFEPQINKTVYAPFDGRVVAARLCDPGLLNDQGKPRFPFGSPNFVLLRHACKIEGTEHVFFSLLMHLGDPELALTGEVGRDRLLSQHAAAIPWLREIALAPDAPEEKQEAENVDPTKLYFKVYRQTKPPTKLGEQELEVGDLLEVAGADVSPEQWEVWNGLRVGEVKRVGDGAKGELDARAFLEAGGMIAPYDAYPTTFTQAKEKLLEGEVVDLWEHELFVRCGEPVGRTGEWHGLDRLHVEIFSKDLIPMKVPVPGDGDEPTWEAKAAVDVDTAGDNQCYFDRAKFMDDFFNAVEEKANEAAGLDGETQALRVRERLMSGLTSKDDGAVIREEEIQRFFNDEHNSLLPFFRNLVVRHLSEWGDKVKWKELEKAKEQLGKPLGPILKTIGEQTEAYCWWTNDVGKDAGLPADQIVHHYHPVSFLRWLEHERNEELPKGKADDLHVSVLEGCEIEGPSGGGGGGGGGSSDGGGDEDDGKRSLVLRLCDAAGGYLEQKRYELEVEGEKLSGESAAGGVIEQRIPENALEGRLKVWVDDGDEPRACPVRFA